MCPYVMVLRGSSHTAPKWPTGGRHEGLKVGRSKSDLSWGQKLDEDTSRKSLASRPQLGRVDWFGPEPDAKRRDERRVTLTALYFAFSFILKHDQLLQLARYIAALVLLKDARCWRFCISCTPYYWRLHVNAKHEPRQLILHTMPLLQAKSSLSLASWDKSSPCVHDIASS
eukprot:1551295-Pleurochrysis_carterae.AAC.1